MKFTGLINEPDIVPLPLWRWFRGGVWVCHRGVWAGPEPVLGQWFRP